MTLGKMLEDSAKRFEKKKAIIFNRRKIIYQELNELVNQAAHGLMELGVRKGEKVAILLTNSPEFIISYFSVLKIGGIVVPINIFLLGEEIKFILNDCEVVMLITSSKFLDLTSQIRSQIKTLRVVFLIGSVKGLDEYISFTEVLRDRPNINPVIDISPADIAVILYTSGTTGYPKGAILTHKNLLANVESCKKAIEITYKDRFLLFLPMFHSFTFTVCVLIPLSAGGRTIILESVKPFSKIIKSIFLDRPTVFVGIPQIYNILADIKVPRFFSLINPIRFCLSGAAPLNEKILIKFEKRFKLPLLEGYGLSEASPVVSINPLKGVRKQRSVGLPIPNVEVKIVDGDGKELPTGEVGELIVKGENVMQGYYNLPQVTQEVIRGGWLFTGDLAKKDEEGYIYIVDRKKDMIIVHGMNVYPREVEDVLCLHPNIAEAVVMKRKDKHYGEIPIAVVVLKEGECITEKEIKDFCHQRIASYKTPHSIEFWNSLPKTPTGKILKREIQNRFE